MDVHVSEDTMCILIDRHGFDRNLFVQHVTDVKGFGQAYTYTYASRSIPKLQSVEVDGHEILRVVCPIMPETNSVPIEAASDIAAPPQSVIVQAHSQSNNSMDSIPTSSP